MPEDASTRRLRSGIDRMRRAWQRYVRANFPRRYRGLMSLAWDGGEGRIGYFVFDREEGVVVAYAHYGFPSVFDSDMKDEAEAAKTQGEQGIIEREYAASEIDTLTDEFFSGDSFGSYGSDIFREVVQAEHAAAGEGEFPRHDPTRGSTIFGVLDDLEGEPNGFREIGAFQQGPYYGA